VYNNIQIFPVPFSLLNNSISASKDLYVIKAEVTALVSTINKNKNNNNIINIWSFQCELTWSSDNSVIGVGHNNSPGADCPKISFES
jgi:hypothetical protein